MPEPRPSDDRPDRRAPRDDDLVAAISRGARKRKQREHVPDRRCRGEQDSHGRIVTHPRPAALTLPAAGRRLNPDEITRISRTEPLTQPVTTVLRPVYHGSGAVSFSTKGEYGVRLMVQLARHFGTGPGQPRRDRRRGGPAARVPRAARRQPSRGGPRRQHPRRPRRLRARPPARGDHDERGPPRARGPHRPDVLRHRRPRARPRLRPCFALHGQPAVGPRPRCGHRRPSNR